MPNRISHLCASLTVTLTFALTAAAQTPPPIECPKIEVSGPPGITNPGEVMAFSGTVSGASSGRLTYVWSIDGGELLSGQGTLTPQIKPHGVWEIQVTVTLEVKGLPDGCPNTASETAGAACNCQAILFDEFSISPNRIDKPRLDALVGSLGKYPNSKLHIIEYFRLRTSEAAVRKKLEMIRKYLVGTHRLEPSDYEVVIEASPDDRESTRFYVIPPGADIPTP